MLLDSSYELLCSLLRETLTITLLEVKVLSKGDKSFEELLSIVLMLSLSNMKLSDDSNDSEVLLVAFCSLVILVNGLFLLISKISDSQKIVK